MRAASSIRSSARMRRTSAPGASPSPRRSRARWWRSRWRRRRCRGARRAALLRDHRGALRVSGALQEQQPLAAGAFLRSVRAARAAAKGWRSRAIFKLEEIDRREKLLRPGQVCLDLGAAPGAWSQYARRQVGRTGRVIATRYPAMPALPGVEFVQGDFREPEVLAGRACALPGARRRCAALGHGAEL